MSGIQQHGFGSLDFFFLYIAERTYACLFPKQVGEAAGAKLGSLRQLLESNFLVHMAMNIVYGPADCPAIRGRVLLVLYGIYKIPQRPVFQSVYLAEAGAGF